MPRIALSTHVPRLIAVSAACGVLAAFGYAAHDATTLVADEPPVVSLAEPAAPIKVTEVVAVRQPAPPPAPTSQLLFVFQLGSDVYLKLSDDEPAHGKRRLLDDGTTTIADVAAAKLPAKFRGWTTKTFTVDGGCAATIKDFAVVTRMEGSPGYAGLDDETWTVATAAKAGTSQLAARLDVSAQCAKGMYARDASLAPLNELEKLDRPELVDAARAALLATELSTDAQIAWAEHGEGSWIDHIQLTSFTRRHPITGQVFVGLHATVQEMGCGGPDINLWTLFRVRRDGTLETVVAKKLDSLYHVERMIDVDNDGALELVGRDWLGLSTVLTRADGEPISELAMPFHGCPC